ncbi:hypothetical protein XNC3_2980001 [Xenorhabdus nematophila F1]|nr:hypothetical protein XNC3_2980001 [Xenorhabdus nematophila F1]
MHAESTLNAQSGRELLVRQQVILSTYWVKQSQEQPRVAPQNF